MTTVPPTPPPPKRGSWVKWLVIGCSGLILVVVVVAVLFWLGISKATAGPEKTVREFLAAAAAGDYAAAHSYFSGPLKQVQPYDEFVRSAQAQPQFFQITHTKFTNRSVDTSGAELSGTVTTTSGSKLPASFKLIHENDQWKLISYQIGS